MPLARSAASRSPAASGRRRSRARRSGKAAGLPRSRPMQAAGGRLRELHDWRASTFLACWPCPVGASAVPTSAAPPAPRSTVTYSAGPIVRVPQGPTLLEISRMKDVPHASVCGGRARCSTCRVGVERGSPTCRRRSSAESLTLGQHHRAAERAARLPDPPAALHHRHAPCPPPAAPAAARGSRPDPQGIEATWSCCSSTCGTLRSICEKRLPYDVVFILNGFFAQVGEAIERTAAGSTSFWATA